MNAVSLLNGSYRTLLGVRNITTATSTWMRVSQPMLAEPLKKKKRLDPNMTKVRIDKKKRKIDKMIRRLERNEGQLKPIEEAEVSLKLRNELKLRQRTLEQLTEEEMDQRREIEVSYSQYKSNQWRADERVLEAAVESQERALLELKKVSESLWFEAIQDDMRLLPFRAEGPLLSLPRPDYEPPDGDYSDISRKWD